MKNDKSMVIFTADSIISTDYDQDLAREIAYKKLISILDDKIQKQVNYDRTFGPISLQAKVLKEFVNGLKNSYFLFLENKSDLHAELFILHHISVALYRYNEERLKMKEIDFKTLIYFPNMLYLIIRIFPRVRNFIQEIMRTIYQEIWNKSSIIQLFTSIPNIDEDVIKSDALYSFIGSKLRDIDPYPVKDLNSFYRSVFRNIFSFYFKSSKDQVAYFSNFNSVLVDFSSASRIKLYRSALFELQAKEFLSKSPTLQQLNYNYLIFKNIIGSNELQDIYFTSKNILVRDNHYRLMKIYHDDIDNALEKEIKDLSLIYRLLKCVKIKNISGKRGCFLIPKKVIENCIFEELYTSFRNFIGDDFVNRILRRVAENFTVELTSGDYVNLLNFSVIKIKDISFLNQLRKFVQFCLRNSFEIN